jgi:hypothetical protein
VSWHFPSTSGVTRGNYPNFSKPISQVRNQGILEGSLSVNPFSFETGFLGVKSVFELILGIFLFVKCRFSVENREIRLSAFSNLFTGTRVCVSPFSVFYPSQRCHAFTARFRTVLQSAAALSQSVSALFFNNSILC